MSAGNPVHPADRNRGSAAAAHAQANLSATRDILPDGLAVYNADDRPELCNTRYREAVNAMPSGPGIYDENDRLVLCNDHMTRWRPHLPVEESLGKTHEELLRDRLRHGIPEVAQGQEELWLAHEMALRGHHSGPEIRHYRWWPCAWT